MPTRRRWPMCAWTAGAMRTGNGKSPCSTATRPSGAFHPESARLGGPLACVDREGPGDEFPQSIGLHFGTAGEREVFLADEQHAPRYLVARELLFDEIAHALLS